MVGAGVDKVKQIAIVVKAGGLRPSGGSLRRIGIFQNVLPIVEVGDADRILRSDLLIDAPKNIPETVGVGNRPGLVITRTECSGCRWIVLTNNILRDGRDSIAGNRIVGKRLA